MVAETASLSPVTVFRPYSEEIQSLVSYSPSPGTQSIVSIGRTTHTHHLASHHLVNLFSLFSFSI